MARPRGVPDIYRGRDPRDLPAYSVAAAAHYLDLPQVTLRRWVAGQSYTYRGRIRTSAPVIALADPARELLSFWNLFEVHILRSLRVPRLISFQKVRDAVVRLRRRYPQIPHPLATFQFAVGGVDIFVEEYGRLINVSRDEQYAMRDCMVTYLRRVERDPEGLVSRLYPFVKRNGNEGPLDIVMDPVIQFGRPVLVGSRIRTAALASRYRAGDSIEALAADYGRTQQEITHAIEYELRADLHPAA